MLIMYVKHIYKDSDIVIKTIIINNKTYTTHTYTHTHTSIFQLILNRF